MKFYQETTAWTVPTPNHIYLLSTDKSKLYGYMKSGTEEPITFKKPIRFDQRGRTFREVKELGEINLDKVTVETWEFEGSKGNKYIVQRLDSQLSCSCPGYQFRGDCRHVKEVDNEV